MFEGRSLSTHCGSPFPNQQLDAALAANVEFGQCLLTLSIQKKGVRSGEYGNERKAMIVQSVCSQSADASTIAFTQKIGQACGEVGMLRGPEAFRTLSQNNGDSNAFAFVLFCFVLFSLVM